MSDIILLFFATYIFCAIFFVVVSAKCFLEKKNIFKLLLLLVLSPAVISIISYFIRLYYIPFDADFVSSTNILSTILQSLIQIVLQIISLFLYVKIVKAKNATISVFLYLCFLAIVPGFWYLIFNESVIPYICYLIIHILFYRLIVIPLVDISKKRQKTELKLFVILPGLTYLFNTIMSLMYMVVYKLSDVTQTIQGLRKFSDETGANIRDIMPFLDVIIKYIKYQYNLFLYPSLFVDLILIIAFHVIIKNVKYTNETIEAKDEIKTLSVEVMEALAHTIDAKDEYTRGHSIRVAKYSKMIAERMGLAPEQCEDIYYMGLLHDIGKIGVPNEIINKPTKLTDEEYGVIKTHPATGYDILAEIKSRPDLATGARWHHERYDGKGYPDHMTGEEIPLEARIIAVADSYDAMTSNRSYRNYLPQDVVREEIEKNIGTQFDENAATCMLQIMDEDKEYTLHE